jgi:hypothetical protein
MSRKMNNKAGPAAVVGARFEQFLDEWPEFPPAREGGRSTLSENRSE